MCPEASPNGRRWNEEPIEDRFWMPMASATLDATVRDESNLTLVTLGLPSLLNQGNRADRFCPRSEQAGVEGAELRTRYSQL
jgi:hypothetical protein